MLCENDNVLGRLAGGAFIAVFDNPPTERLDHLGKQQYLGCERADEVVLVRYCVGHSQYMEIAAHVNPFKISQISGDGRGPTCCESANAAAEAVRASCGER